MIATIVASSAVPSPVGVDVGIVVVVGGVEVVVVVVIGGGVVVGAGGGVVVVVGGGVVVVVVVVVVNRPFSVSRNISSKRWPSAETATRTVPALSVELMVRPLSGPSSSTTARRIV